MNKAIEEFSYIEFTKNVDNYRKGQQGKLNSNMAKKFIQEGKAKYLDHDEKGNFIPETSEIKGIIANFEFINLGVEAQAEEIINKNPLYFDKFKQWRKFDKKKKAWVNIDEIDIMNYLKKTFSLSGLSHSNIRSTMLNALRDEARGRKPEEVSEYQIQIGKYIYDIRNNEKIEINENTISYIRIPHDIDSVKEDEDCPNIDGLFDDWVGEHKQALYDIIAFCMSPIYFLDICFWLVGSGDNGKGLFLMILTKILGFENVTSQDLELLSDPKDRFTKGFLQYKLLCSLGDGNYQKITFSKALKSLSGRKDPIRNEKKGGGQTEFYNTAKLLGSFNTLPETSDKTPGFYRRQYTLVFPNSFTGMKNPLTSISEREYTILAYKCWKRLQEIYKTNNIYGWGDIEDRKEKYEKLSNPIGRFIKEDMIEDYEGYAFGKTLHKHYIQYAIKKGYNKFSLKDFEARLINQGYEKKRKDVYHYNGYCWGKQKDIPETIKETIRKNGDEIGYDKFQVYNGLSFLDKIDKIDRVLGLDFPYEKTNSKKVSKVSKVSKILNYDYILEEFDSFKVDETISETKFVSYLLEKYDCNENQVYNYIDSAKKKGDFIEVKSGVLMKG